jgi:8-oxo-dGTP pyrophosphatase MutT (NUDIX family)
MPADSPYCPNCGAAFAEPAGWPRRCAGCGRTTYRNPIPVAVVLLPIVDRRGLLAIRRAIEPGKGKPALPGGYVDWNDRTWQDGAARELREETGIRVRPSGIREFRVISSPEKKLVILFCLAEGIRFKDIPAFEPNEEISELAVLTKPVTLAFSSHTAVVKEYFAGRRRGK